MENLSSVCWRPSGKVSYAAGVIMRCWCDSLVMTALSHKLPYRMDLRYVGLTPRTNPLCARSGDFVESFRFRAASLRQSRLVVALCENVLGRPWANDVAGGYWRPLHESERPPMSRRTAQNPLRFTPPATFGGSSV